QILRENNLAPKLPADLNALIQKAASIRKHVATHKIDLEARYGLMLTESKIRSLAKYYKREKVLPVDWKYVAAERVA
ncbi:TPA: 30S ribosomal protein S15, partial [archaeon]|nr:30S ribosomal protein S15 [Candidatus Naiadarchaeales archaeon SRR2090153.bin1042]